MQVEAVEQNKAKVTAADGGVVIGELTKGPAFDGSVFFEFEGWVQSPNTMREESRTSYGSSFGELLILPSQNHHVCTGLRLVWVVRQCWTSRTPSLDCAEIDPGTVHVQQLRA